MMRFSRLCLSWGAPLALVWPGLPAAAADIPFNPAFTESVPVPQHVGDP